MWKTLTQAVQGRGGYRGGGYGYVCCSVPTTSSPSSFFPSYTSIHAKQDLLARRRGGGGGGGGSGNGSGRSRLVSLKQVEVRRALRTLAIHKRPLDRDNTDLFGPQESEGYCPGCGIRLQSESDERPGYYQKPGAGKQDPRLISKQLFGIEGGDGGAGASAVEVGGAKKEVFCARCFSLRNYGKVKNPLVEDQLPSFDVASKLCQRIINVKGIRQVLLCVVDVTDFDGSIPTQTLNRIFSDSQIKEKNLSFIIAVNKVDLLPRIASDQRLQTWTKKQIRGLDLPKDVSIKLVSAAVGKGIPELASTLESKVGQYGHLWVFGAQNAGKSSLINALRRYAKGEKGPGRKNKQQLTEASLPGTTIGFVRLENLIAGSRCKAFDTPGILHKYQFTSTFSPLSYQEISMLLPRRKLKPRTFRCMAGYSIAIGGLARVDLVSSPGKTLYLTLWASDEVTHHFGKTENAESKQSQAVGVQLLPPVSQDDMPHLVPSEFLINGNTWKKSSEDIAIAGLGWIAVGVSGECKLRIWAPKSVLLYQREALMPDYAAHFERPGHGQMLPNSK